MTRFPRLLLGVALVVGLAPSARAAEPDKMLPADADSVVVVNVKQILGSEIIKKYALEQIKQLLDGADAKQLLTDLGIDPLKDVDKVVAASVDTKVNNPGDGKFLLVVHGAFDPDKLTKTAEAYAKKDGETISIIKDGNTTLFKFQPPNGQAAIYAAIANKTTVLASNERKMVSAALKAADSQTPPALKKEIADLLRKADDKASVYVVSLLKGKLDDVKLPGGGNLPIKLDALEKVLPKLETALIAVNIGADVLMDVTLGMKDEDSAGDMRNALDDILKDLKPLAQLAGAAEPRLKPLGDILASVKTSSKNKDVTITGKVTGAQIGKIVNPKGE